MAQTEFTGNIQLQTTKNHTPTNIVTSIIDMENNNVVFLDTLIEGSMDFNFFVVGLKELGFHETEIILTSNIPGYADYNLTYYSQHQVSLIKISNAFGKDVVAEKQITHSYDGEKTSFYINLSNNANGIYFITVVTADGVSRSTKVLKSGNKLSGQENLILANPFNNKLKSAFQNIENYLFTYKQIYSDSDLTRIVDFEKPENLNPGTNNIIHNAQTVPYPQYFTSTVGRITIGDQNLNADHFNVTAVNADDLSQEFDITTDEQGNFTYVVERNPSEDKPYVEGSNKNLLVTVSGPNTATLEDQLVVLDESSEVINFNVNPMYIFNGPATKEVVVKGESGEEIGRINPISGEWNFAFDTTKTTLNNINLSSQGDGFYSKEVEFNSLNYGEHNVDMSLDTMYLYQYLGSATNGSVGTIQGEGIDTAFTIEGNSFESNVYDSRDGNKTVTLSFEKDGHYKKDTNVVGNGFHTLDMTLDTMYLYSYFGATNAEQINITGEDIDTTINVGDGTFASREYDSREGDKVVNLEALAFGYQTTNTNVMGSGEHEINFILSPNEFGLYGTINQDDVNMKFVVGEDTTENTFSNNYTFSKSQVTDSIDVNVIAEKDWFDKVDTTLRIGPQDNEYNVEMNQNRWGFSISGEGNVPVNLEDGEGKNLGMVSPTAGFWDFDMDTTVNAFTIHVYTDEADKYNKDTVFTAVAGENTGIDMTADQKYFYQFGGSSTDGAPVVISGALVDTTINSGENFQSFVYHSRDSNLEHNISSSKTGYQDKNVNVSGHGYHNSLDLILAENEFQLTGTSAPSGGNLTVIADPAGSQDTVYNAVNGESYTTSTTQKAAETIEYRIIAEEEGYESLDTVITRNKGLQIFDYSLEASSLQPVSVKNAVRIDGSDYVIGAMVIYEHMSQSGLQRDTAYTSVSNLLAEDTIYTDADLSTVKFIRYVEDCAQSNYNFVPDTTENISLVEGVNGPYQVEVNSYDQVEDIIFEMVKQDGSPAVGAKAKIEYDGGGVYGEAIADATGIVTFEDVPAGLDLLLTAGYEWATDTTRMAYKDVPYSTPANGSITEIDKEQIWYFKLDDRKIKIPGAETGTAQDSIWMDAWKIAFHGGGAANVRRTMGLDDQFYLSPSTYNNIPADTLTKWADEIENDYYNNERQIIFVDEPFELNNSQEFIDFDYITNPDSTQLLGWNISDGTDNTDDKVVLASNGDLVSKGGSITISGNKIGFRKEFAARTNDITNAANDYASPSERTAIYYIVNQRQERYETITQTEKKVPTVNYIDKEYE